MSAGALAAQPPKVLLWFKLYCGFLCVLYLGTAAFSIVLFFTDPGDAEFPKVAACLFGGVLLATSAVLFCVCLLPLLLSPRPWLCTFDLVVICLGMTSACFLPICIPLLIFWLKPETKKYFGNMRA